MAEEDSKSQVGDENMEKEVPESPKPPKTPMKAKAAQKAKASPKAPVKKPKAKAAKAKAKTKVTKASLKKKPAANKGAKTDKSEDEEPPTKVTPKAKAKAKANLKRPAAAGASSSKGAPDWASGIQLEKEDETGAEGEEEAPKTMDAVVDADDMEVFETDQAKKDRSKDFKFKQLLAQNSLPAWVVKAWNETLKLKTGRVAKQREIVNQVLDRTSSGTLVVNLDKPVLSHIKDLWAFQHKRLCLHSLLDYFTWTILSILPWAFFLEHFFTWALLLQHLPLQHFYLTNVYLRSSIWEQVCLKTVYLSYLIFFSAGLKKTTR